MASDASSSWGCGAWFGPDWFQLEWPDKAQELPIMVKEMVPIVIACALWSKKWENHLVLCHCDNQAVVASIRSRTSKNKHCMRLLRTLAFVEACHCCYLQPVYINTALNDRADDLSRNNLQSFFSKVPQVNSNPEPLPLPFINLLLEPDTDWTSSRWLHLFRSILMPVSHPPPTSLTPQHWNAFTPFVSCIALLPLFLLMSTCYVVMHHT